MHDIQPTQDFDADLKLQEKFVKEIQPDVIVGSSYGGAIAVTMLQKGFYLCFLKYFFRINFSLILMIS